MKIDPVEELKRCLKGKTKRALAREWKMSAGRICDALSGRRPVGNDMLAQMGLIETTVVRRRASR